MSGFAGSKSEQSHHRLFDFAKMAINNIFAHPRLLLMLVSIESLLLLHALFVNFLTVILVALFRYENEDEARKMKLWFESSFCLRHLRLRGKCQSFTREASDHCVIHGHEAKGEEQETLRRIAHKIRDIS